jgi:hypothetical protein
VAARRQDAAVKSRSVFRRALVRDRIVVGNRHVVGIRFFIRNRLFPWGGVGRHLVFVVSHLVLHIAIGSSYRSCMQCR